MRAVISISVLLLIGSLCFLLGCAHDFMGRRATHYAAGFSEVAFRSISTGDTREHVIELLGQPVNRYYVLHYSNGFYNSHPIVPLSELPSGSSIDLEVYEYSAPIRPRLDFRLVEVLLDSKGHVESTRDYVTD